MVDGFYYYPPSYGSVVALAWSMHLSGLFTRQLFHPQYNIHSSNTLKSLFPRSLQPYIAFPLLPSSTTLSLSFPAFLFSSVTLVLPSSSFSSPLTVLLCPLFPFLPLLSFLPPHLHVSLYPLSTSHSPCSSLLSPPPFPLIWLLRYFPLNPLSDVGGCSMLGIDCTLEFVVKAQHRPDNLSVFFSLSGSGERLKLPNRK